MNSDIGFISPLDNVSNDGAECLIYLAYWQLHTHKVIRHLIVRGLYALYRGTTKTSHEKAIVKILNRANNPNKHGTKLS